MKFKRRFRYNKKRVFIYLFFIMLLSTLTLGYSLLSTTLQIEGVGKISKAVWNIHFDNIQPKEGSITPTQAPTISNDTNISFSLKLNEPGEFYEFTADIVNEGTIDAKIDSFSILPVLTDAQKKYFNYTVTYENGTEIKTNDALNAGTTEKIKVRFEYLTQEDTSLYPTEDQEFTFEVDIDYVQGKGNEVDHEYPKLVLSGKKVIVLGERDGIPGPAIQVAAESAGADVVYSATEASAEMEAPDIENQRRIINLVNQYGAKNVVVILGAQNEEVAEMYSETVTIGDPTYTGPLTGVALHLPVYHICEEEVKNLVDQNVYDEQISMMEMVIDTPAIAAVVKRIREEHSLIP